MSAAFLLRKSFGAPGAVTAGRVPGRSIARAPFRSLAGGSAAIATTEKKIRGMVTRAFMKRSLDKLPRSQPSGALPNGEHFERGTGNAERGTFERRARNGERRGIMARGTRLNAE